jgi:hypothetical protein
MYLGRGFFCGALLPVCKDCHQMVQQNLLHNQKDRPRYIQWVKPIIPALFATQTQVKPNVNSPKFIPPELALSRFLATL